MTSYVIRHGESVGNHLDIIQGGDLDPPLTERGTRHARTVANELATEIEDLEAIYASPLRRAQETAAVLTEQFDAPIRTEPLLREFDPGVISGYSKDVLADRYPSYLEVWERRHDLDPIPEAETGDEVQARAILALETVLSRGDGDRILVGHAGFNRYLVNTARRRERTTPIGHEPTTVHALERDEIDVRSRELTRATTASVRRVSTRETSLVVKRIPDADARQLRFQRWVSEFVNRKQPTFPSVLAWTVTSGAGRLVMTDAPGRHIRGPLSADRERTLCETVHVLSTLLKAAERDVELESLESMLRRLIDRVEGPVERFGRRLLDSDRFQAVIDEGERCPVHYDLHRSNLLFGDDGPTILDLDGFCIAPPLFQPAALFMAAFLLEEPESFELNRYRELWPEPVDDEKLPILMLARSFIGLAFFEDRRRAGTLTESNYELLERYADATRRIRDEYLGQELGNVRIAPDWDQP